MIINCQEMDEQLHLKPYPDEKAVAAAKRGDATIWLNLGDCQSEEGIEKWLDELGVSVISRHLLTTPHNRSGFYPLKNELLFVTPYTPLTPDSSEIVFVSFLCMKIYLLLCIPNLFPNCNILTCYQNQQLGFISAVLQG